MWTDTTFSADTPSGEKAVVQKEDVAQDNVNLAAPVPEEKKDFRRKNELQLSTMTTEDSAIMDVEGYMITSAELGKSIFRRSIGTVRDKSNPSKPAIPITDIELSVNAKDVRQLAQTNPELFDVDKTREIAGVELLGFVAMKNALAGLVYLADAETGKTGCEVLPIQDKNNIENRYWKDIDKSIGQEANPENCSLSFRVRVQELSELKAVQGRSTPKIVKTLRAKTEVCRYPSAGILHKSTRTCLEGWEEDLSHKRYLFLKNHEDRLARKILDDFGAATKSGSQYSNKRYYDYETFGKTHDAQDGKNANAGHVSDIFGALLPSFWIAANKFVKQWTGLSSDYAKRAESVKFKEQIKFFKGNPDKMQRVWNEKAGTSKGDFKVDLAKLGIDSVETKYFQALTPSEEEEEDGMTEAYSDDPDFELEISPKFMELNSDGISITFTPISVSKGALEFADSDEQVEALKNCQDTSALSANGLDLCQQNYKILLQTSQDLSDTVAELTTLDSKDSSSKTLTDEQYKALGFGRIISLTKETNKVVALANALMRLLNPDLPDSKLYHSGQSVTVSHDNMLWKWHDSQPKDSEQIKPYLHQFKNNDGTIVEDSEGSPKDEL
ncbi:hypothetical protein GZ77_18530 [Endozoicomonas montiporae]|uniref:Uncharacterized protein n=1 Tax=Endozoicomonas montiporae TaxID=1027273 RepID=A0A081N240_9GAMM|nr:hypothetical protein GZ77_18530 [Endozoicomonas montiporae]